MFVLFLFVLVFVRTSVVRTSVVLVPPPRTMFVRICLFSYECLFRTSVWSYSGLFVLVVFRSKVFVC